MQEMLPVETTNSAVTKLNLATKDMERSCWYFHSDGRGLMFLGLYCDCLVGEMPAFRKHKLRYIVSMRDYHSALRW